MVSICPVICGIPCFHKSKQCPTIGIVHVETQAIATRDTWVHIQMWSNTHDLSCSEAWNILGARGPEEYLEISSPYSTFIPAGVLTAVTLPMCFVSLVLLEQPSCTNIISQVLFRYVKRSSYYTWQHELPAREWNGYGIGMAQVYICMR